MCIGCSDLHFDNRTPIARSVEHDWYEVQGSYINQLKHLQVQCGSCPILIAGDLTNRWNLPPEIINFLLKHLPDNIYAVPGQHDLPNHSYDNIRRSAYWTLVESGKIKNLEPGNPTEIAKGMGNEWYAVGFPWGVDVEPTNIISDCHFIAVVHSYIWKKNFRYTGAPEEKRVKKYLPLLKGYRAAFFGDNHIGFTHTTENGKLTIMNCGTFIRRRIDEINYTPSVGILCQDGSITPWPLHTLEDQFLDVSEAEELVEKALGATEFLQELVGLGKHVVDFGEALKRFCEKNKVSKPIRDILTSILEDV